MLLYFSISPIQEFIAQARKTRDFWTGSWLLSYLIGHAINAVDASKIIVPDVNSDFLAFINTITDGGSANQPPDYGSLPNYFIMEVQDEDDGVNSARNAKTRIESEWHRIADMVKNKYVKGISKDNIWDPQVNEFWKIKWIVVPENETRGLELLKTWRDFSSTEIVGNPCKIMTDYIEISGYAGVDESSDRDKFWNKVRKEIGEPNLRKNEWLSAVALIKRAFPLITDDLEIDEHNSFKNWPSVATFAALPWIRHVEKVDLYKEIEGILCSDDYSRRNPVKEYLPNFECEYLYLDKLDDDNDDTMMQQGNKKKLRGLLKSISEDYGEPSPFYALLIMDGDNFGQIIKEIGRKSGLKGIKNLSKTLSEFNKCVSEIVTKNNGTLVYAGGDDVLALFPIDRVIQAAYSIEMKYVEKTKEIAQNIDMKKMTMSAGVVFANISHPLREVVEEAHYQIDVVAKNQNGRGSISVSVLKRSGRNAQYCTTWDDTILSNIGTIIHDIHKGKVPSSIIYKMIDFMNRMGGMDQWFPGQYLEIPLSIEDDDFLKVIANKLKSTRRNNDDEISMEDVKRISEYTLNLIRPKSYGKEKEMFLVDGLYVLRFLSDNIFKEESK